jgi:HSP20 family protein
MADLATTSNGAMTGWRGYDLFDPFRSFFQNLWPSMVAGIDVQSTEKGYTVEVPVPGFAPNEIEVTYQDGAISISGKSERRSLMRTLVVPEEVDPDNVQAVVENGLLTLTLNRLPHAQPKRIAVHAN